MPATVHQLLEGTSITSGDQPSATTRYAVLGVSSQADALGAALAAAPATLNVNGTTLLRGAATVENLDHEKCTVAVDYGVQQSDGTSLPLPSWEFSTGGGNETMFVSLSTKQRILASGLSGTAPNYYGAVNVTDSGAQGVSRVVPSYNFSETRYWDPAFVTGAFKANIFYCTGGVNAAGWGGFNAGEVLFLGARGSLTLGGWWQITYNFSALPNLANGSIGPFNGVYKDGWDYLWFLYDEMEDSSAKRVVKRPVACFVEQVYARKNFYGLLGF